MTDFPDLLRCSLFPLLPADKKLLKAVENFSQEGENSSSIFYLNLPHDPFTLHLDSHTATLVCVEAVFVI